MKGDLLNFATKDITREVNETTLAYGAGLTGCLFLQFGETMMLLEKI